MREQFAYVASAWLVCIALALLTTGHFFDVAVRDLAKLMGIRERSTVEVSSGARALQA